MDNTTVLPAPHKTDPLNKSGAIVIHANYEMFIVALLVLQLVNSIWWLLVSDPEQLAVLEIIGGGIGVFLLLDACYRLFKAPSKNNYLWTYHGWLVFVGSLPLPFFCLARLLWYGLMVRTLRKSDFGLMQRVVVEQRARSTLLIAILAGILVVELASMFVLHTELGARGANIHTASDAIWWSLVTIATVGYGDKYPVTNPGRIVGVGLMVVGVGLFSVFTSYLAQWFFLPKKAQLSPTEEPNTENPDDLRASLEEIRRMLDLQGNEHRQSTTSLHERLDAIEKRLG
jgi:voltage-gated potassium channel Kch